MGGRGSSGGVMVGASTAPRKGYNWTSADKTTYRAEKPLQVERVTGMGAFGSDAIVLSATSDGNGNITLGYATEDGYRQQNSKTSYAQYTLRTGITNLDGNKFSREGLRSVGINWENVKTVSGRTYGTQSLMREKGFVWDRDKKIWKKP